MTYFSGSGLPGFAKREGSRTQLELKLSLDSERSQASAADGEPMYGAGTSSEKLRLHQKPGAQIQIALVCLHSAATRAAEGGFCCLFVQFSTPDVVRER